MVDVPVCRSSRFIFLVVAQWQLPWSRLFVGPFASTVAVHGYQCPCCEGRAGSLLHRGAEADSMVQTVRRTIFFPGVHGGRRPCCAGRAGSFPRRGTETVSMVQTVRLTMDILQLLITVADVPVARSCSSRVHTWRRQSNSHGCTRGEFVEWGSHHLDDELMG